MLACLQRIFNTLPTVPNYIAYFHSPVTASANALFYQKNKPLSCAKNL